MGVHSLCIFHIAQRWFDQTLPRLHMVLGYSRRSEAQRKGSSEPSLESTLACVYELTTRDGERKYTVLGAGAHSPNKGWREIMFVTFLALVCILLALSSVERLPRLEFSLLCPDCGGGSAAEPV